MNKFAIRVKAKPKFSPRDVNGNYVNSYVQMRPVYGFNFLPVNIVGGAQQNITIQRRTTDYVNTEKNTTDFNKPIGYFTDTTDITSDITEDRILLTYKYDKNNIQVLSINYAFTESSNTDNFSLVETNNGSCYIYYSINNSLKLPSLKVTSSSGYSITEAPYDIDQVRYFEEVENSDTLSFLTTYKDIKPNTPRTSVGNITTSRFRDYTEIYI